MRGGKRSGSGRPKGDGSKVIRVPLGCLSDVEAVIAAFRNDDSFSLEKHREFNRDKAAQVSNERVKRNKFNHYKNKYEKLPRSYRRSLMKKYKKIESIVEHLIETNEQDLNIKK